MTAGARALNPAAFVRARFRTWWQARLPRTDTLLLTQGNVYILPTRAGWMFGLTLLVLLLASINYQLNLGYVLTFLLAGSGVVSMHLTHAHPARPDPAPAAGRAGLRRRAGGARRRADQPGHAALRHRPAPARCARRDPGLDRRARRRPGDGAGQLRAGRARLARGAGAERRDPLSARPVPRLDGLAAGGAAAGLSAARAQRAGAAGGPAGRRRADPLAAREGGEIEGVRAYRRGDPLKLVAWKKAAQALETGGELVSRDTSASARQELWLDWAACGVAGARGAAVAAGRVDARGRPRRHRLRPAPARPRDRARGRRGAAPALPGGAGAVERPDEAGPSLPSPALLPAALAGLAAPAARSARHAVPARRDRLDRAAARCRTCPAGPSRLTAVVLLWRGQLAVESGPLPAGGSLVARARGRIGLTCGPTAPCSARSRASRWRSC